MLRDGCYCYRTAVAPVALSVLHSAITIIALRRAIAVALNFQLRFDSSADATYFGWSYAEVALNGAVRLAFLQAACYFLFGLVAQSVLLVGFVQVVALRAVARGDHVQEIVVLDNLHLDNIVLAVVQFAGADLNLFDVARLWQDM